VPTIQATPAVNDAAFSLYPQTAARIPLLCPDLRGKCLEYKTSIFLRPTFSYSHSGSDFVRRQYINKSLGVHLRNDNYVIRPFPQKRYSPKDNLIRGLPFKSFCRIQRNQIHMTKHSLEEVTQLMRRIDRISLSLD
jgi:hypothetical protein